MVLKAYSCKGKGMNVAILRAGSVDPMLLPHHSEYPGMIISMLRSVIDGIEFSCFEVENNVFPESAADFDAYIVTGSKYSVYDNCPWIADSGKFLLAADMLNKTLIGICFGHQLLAQTFGGRVERSDKGWGLGVAEFNVCKQQSWMQPAVSSFSLLVSHQDQVTCLPAKAELLAGNTFCPNACFQFGGNVLGLQGHPEFTKQYLTELMVSRSGHISGSCIMSARRSLELATHERLVARWIVAFLMAGMFG